MSLTTSSRTALLASAALFTAAIGVHTADAQTLAALTDGSKITWIDAAKMKVTGSVTLQGGASLVGFDVRPADGMLYGVTAAGDIVTVDAKTGMWTKKSTISEKLPTGVTFSIDFNPMADRMRLIASDGTSFRINVEDGKTVVDGKLRYADADANKGKTPKVTAVAYSNSFAGTKETALYDFDTANGVFVKQAPPNDGILNTLGAFGVKFDGPVAFDIWSDGKGANMGWALSGDTLYSVDLASGVAKQAGKIAGLKGKVSDIAILPSMPHM
jgi:hypothetical protein